MESGEPVTVRDCQVPVLTVIPHKLQPEQWDLTTTQILPYIDGFNHIAKISSLADVGSGLVRACVQNLLYHKVRNGLNNLNLIVPVVFQVVGITTIFQYSNVYTVTPLMSALRRDKQLQQDLLTSIARREGDLPSFRDVYTFISSFTYGTTVKDLCQRMSPSRLGFDETRLVQYCVLRGILRRVHKYPVWTEEEGGGEARLTSWMTGDHDTDEICVATGVPSAYLDTKLEEWTGVVVIWK